MLTSHSPTANISVCDILVEWAKHAVHQICSVCTLHSEFVSSALLLPDSDVLCARFLPFYSYFKIQLSQRNSFASAEKMQTFENFLLKALQVYDVLTYGNFDNNEDLMKSW